ncbi:MAG: AMP-binding protein [Sphingopyxis sp.]|uniref:AMP-binding protein n=1 Tax=Sphingopyxis sp. TaxID=1908224 RepID=UPI002AB7F480|nr:AMP-binding protein [Sphingopyxis sp.]MDZ3833627.1 AMP-binding protein [Sphingopyxis sp.]
MTSGIYLGARLTARAIWTERARRLAAALRDMGVGEDDVIAVLLRNDVAYFEVVEACRYLGAYYVPLNWHGSRDELLSIIQDSGARLLIGHSDLTVDFMAVAARSVPIIAVSTPDEILAAYSGVAVTPDGQIDYDRLVAETAPIEGPPRRYRGVLAYTSGSTGRPKGIRRIAAAETPDAYTKFAEQASAVLQLRPNDRFYVAAPLYHSAPNALSIFCLAAGYADLFIAPKFDPELFLSDVASHGITHCYIVPTMMARLLKLPEAVRSRYDLSTLRFGISTGSPWPADMKRAMIDWLGPIFYESYGASELGFMTLISSAESLRKPGSVGQVLPGGEIRILDDNGRPLPAGQEGSIFVDFPTSGGFSYSNVAGDLDGQRQGRFATVGDVGYLDEEGYLFICDRKKDMIISGGANIFPAEIEAALIEMPQVADCAVFGAPHDEFGEMVVAAVQCVPGETLTQQAVAQFLSARIARFKIPRQIDLHGELPREDSGKIFKQRLRAPYWDSAGRQI